jgi:hypothetical protein
MSIPSTPQHATVITAARQHVLVNVYREDVSTDGTHPGIDAFYHASFAYSDVPFTVNDDRKFPPTIDAEHEVMPQPVLGSDREAHRNLLEEVSEYLYNRGHRQYAIVDEGAPVPDGQPFLGWHRLSLQQIPMRPS